MAWATRRGVTQSPMAHPSVSGRGEDVRTPTRNNWDFVATKDVRLKGSMRGQIKFEVLNLTNTVKVRGPISTVGSSTFGQIRVQSGFQRLTQIMFRMSF